jgi:hypothetical protein
MFEIFLLQLQLLQMHRLNFVEQGIIFCILLNYPIRAGIITGVPQVPWEKLLILFFQENSLPAAHKCKKKKRVFVFQYLFVSFE